ncbi:immunoglobulin superfamily member 10-like [Discoglossus pictus]
MKPLGRSHPYLLGLIVSIWFIVLPNSSRACPKPCACYVSTEVHCTFRYLTVIPRQIQTDVKRINLGYNSLSNLEENDFSGLKELELLMLHSNEIQSIHENAFNDLSSLQVLKMSYNKVKTLHKNTFHGLKSMVRLHMDHNKLEFMYPESFYGLTSLKLVHLEGNMLTQLHTDTFVTLRYIQIFKTSTIKHIYLSDNHLSSLPKDMFLYMTELEGIYLHGNPWSCDCHLQWLTEETQQSRDTIKCKRDRTGVQCPVCASPRKNMGKSLNEISSQQLTCVKPTIENIFKIKNITTTEEGSFTTVSPKDFVAPMGSLILNMTDQAGNEANLACSVQRPTKMSQITLDAQSEYTIMRTTFSSFLVCSIDYEHIQKLWGILAMYSDSPMKLKRELLLTKTPFISYKYKQSTSDEEVFTDIEAELRAEPNWLMQDMVTLQLDRTATTLNTLHIRFLTDVYVTIPNVMEKPHRSSWVMIQKSNQTKTEYSAVIGGTVEMNCQVLGEPTPSIEWVLPDGTKIRAPYTSEEGRVTITRNGKFILKAADSFDTGVYHCIGTNYIEADVLSFRITVVSRDVEEDDVNGAELSVTSGDELYLPCGSNGIPDASVSWIFPDHSVLHETSRYKHIFLNGTLKLQQVTDRDRGHFRCIAANQYGLDILTFKVLIKEQNHIVKQKISFSQHEDQNSEGSGNEETEEHSKHSAKGKSIERRRFPVRIPLRERFAKLNGKVNRNFGTGSNQENKRFRGQRRQFTQNTRRIDPQRWSEILEKTKKSAISTKKEMQVIESSAKENDIERVSGDLDEPSGEELIPVEETFVILTTRHTTVNIQTGVGAENTGSPSPTNKIFVAATANLKEMEIVRTEKENSEMIDISPEPTILEGFTTSISSPSSKQHFDTITHATISDNRDHPTTHNYLDNLPNEVTTKPQTTSNVMYSTPKDVTSTPNIQYIKPQTIVSDHPSSTTSSFYTAPPNIINTPFTTPSYTQATNQESITEPFTTADYFHVTSQEVIAIPTRWFIRTTNYIYLFTCDIPKCYKQTPYNI